MNEARSSPIKSLVQNLPFGMSGLVTASSQLPFRIISHFSFERSITWSELQLFKTLSPKQKIWEIPLASISLITALVSLVASISSILFAVINNRRTNKKDDKNEGILEGQILTDINYIKNELTNQNNNLTKLNDNYHELDVRLAKVEEKILIEGE